MANLLVALAMCSACLAAPLSAAEKDNAGSDATDESAGWFDLLELVDPERDAVAGAWRMKDGELEVGALPGARLALPWKPVDEYDFEISFTRKTGANSIALIFVCGGRQASLDVDGWGEHLAGIQNVAERTIRDNPTRVPDWSLTNGQTYTATLRVRKDRAQALVDGKELTIYRGDGSDLSLLDLWRLPDESAIGVAAWDGATTFHRVRVRPVSPAPAVTGKPGDRPATKTARTRPSTGKPARGQPDAPSADDIAALSDEFDDPATLRDWRRVFEDERSGADQLQQYDIGRAQRGWMTMIPHASTWYQDYRGVLAHKLIEGDFVATTQVRSTNRAGNGPPRSAYSLAGIMVRAPRDVTPQTWRPGGENYIFLSLGAASNPGQFAFEVKTTLNSRSDLSISAAPGPQAMIRVARIGAAFVLLRKEPNGPWIVHQRYRRPDMPPRLQVGFTVYTDYAFASRMQPAAHNTRVIRGGNPDLKASFDYMRYRRPQPPAALEGRNFADSQSVSDGELLSFLGDE